MLLKEVAARLFEHLVDHDWHGYSWISRWGDGEGTCDIVINGKTYHLEQGDRDCSSAIISAYEAAGISCGGATYTGNMRQCMCATGNFIWHPMSSGYVAKRGDIYLNEANHTAMCISDVPDMLGEFSISETGGTDGAEGDQTGYESHRGAFYDYPWNGILECVCTATDGADTGHEDKQVIVNATVQDNSGADYMRLKFECVDDAEQIYRITDKENGYFMTAAANAANANVDFRSFSCGKYQMWRMLKKRYLKADYTMFECVATPGLYLSVENNGIGGKDNLKLYTDLHNMQQKFYVREEKDMHTLVIHAFSGKCISAKA